MFSLTKLFKPKIRCNRFLLDDFTYPVRRWWLLIHPFLSLVVNFIFYKFFTIRIKLFTVISQSQITLQQQQQHQQKQHQQKQQQHQQQKQKQQQQQQHQQQQQQQQKSL